MSNVNDSDNPLLDRVGLPRFDEINAEHVTPALDNVLAAAYAAVERAGAPDTPADWQTVVTSIEQATEPLWRVWGIVGHLNAVADTPALRAVYSENLARVTEFSAALGQNSALYTKYQMIAAASESLSPARQRCLDNALRDFRLSGAALATGDKPRFTALQARQAHLSKTFSDHVLDATDAYAYFIVEEAELAGLPEEVVVAARQAAEQAGHAGWKFTLHFPSYFPVMQYAQHRPLREALYRAYVTRASALGPDYGQGQAVWDNTENMIEQLALRTEEAQLLGYRNAAEVSLASKMAQTSAQVFEFLHDLAQRARPYAQQEWAQLQAFAAAELDLPVLAAWDIAFAAEALRQQRYAFSDHEVKAYFPEDRVLQGLFLVVQTLFGVKIVAAQAAVWHPDVRFFQVERQDGSVIAHFYLDLYARTGKRGGAWMDDARGRRRLADGSVQTPAAYLVCNFSAPVNDKQPCLSHDEVMTLFHECGHGLHHMLTQVDEPGVAGINGVEWDAVELPSQFMENFCWEWEVLANMTAHVETGVPLPRPLFDKMVAAKHFQSGLGMLRQAVLALFDMHLHTDFDLAATVTMHDLAQTLHRQYHVIPQAVFSRWPNTFSHIFAGGYAAGYYSYQWAEVLSADAYAAFEEAAEREAKATRTEHGESAKATLLNPTLGAHYRAEILEVGASRPAMASFIAFRGRAPTIDALLRQYGMTLGV